MILLMSVQGIGTRNIAALRKINSGEQSSPSDQLPGFERESKNNTIVMQQAK